MSEKFPFALKEIFIPNVLFRLNPSFKPKEGKVEINTTIEIDFSQKNKDLSVHVRIEMPDGENAPFSFAIEGIGRFVFKEEPPTEIVEGIARVNGAAMIFPYLREAIADLTRRAGVPPLHLQPVNFVAMLGTEKSEAKGISSPKKIAAKKKTL